MRVSDSAIRLPFCSAASWSGFIGNKAIMPACKRHAETVILAWRCCCRRDVQAVPTVPAPTLIQAQASKVYGKCRWVLDRRPCCEEANVRFDFSFEDNDETNELAGCRVAVAAIGRPTDRCGRARGD